MEPTKELDILFPDDQIYGYAIRKLKFKDFKIAIAIVQRNTALFSGDLVGALLSAETLEDLTTLILLAVEITPEELDELEIAQVIEVVLKAFEVNATFFIQTLNQRMAQVAAEVGKEAGEKSPVS
jgi:hypothetical protein